MSSVSNLITVQGGAFTDVKKALQQWADGYSDQLPKDYTIKLYRNGRGNHVVVPDPLENIDLFFYLVNYLEYPEDITYKVKVEGFVTGKGDARIEGKAILVYVPEDDKEYDNVYVVTEEGKQYKIDFGGKITAVQSNKSYEVPNLGELSAPSLISMPVVKEEAKEGIQDKLKNRFDLIYKLCILLFAVNIIVPEITGDFLFFGKSTMILQMGVMLWFMMDEELLQMDRFFVRCLAISLAVLLYQALIFIVHGEIQAVDTSLGSMMPISYLVVNWPARKLFVKLLKREPEFRGETFADIIYTFVVVGSVAIPFIVHSNLL
jgi:hypothetical protein